MLHHCSEAIAQQGRGLVAETGCRDKFLVIFKEQSLETFGPDLTIVNKDTG